MSRPHTKFCIVSVLFLMLKSLVLISFVPKDFVVYPLVTFDSTEFGKIFRFDLPEKSFDGNYVVLRKELNADLWQKVDTLPKGQHTYSDTIPNEMKFPLEYGFHFIGDTNFAAGYYVVGNSDSIPINYGFALILVDETLRDTLFTEIEQFKQDLIADGWVVETHSVPRSETFNPIAVRKVKRLINSYFHRFGSNLKAIVLVGRVPVPYSGNYAFDGHSNHIGAFPSDLFYACKDCQWTDDSEFNNGASRTENHNLPFDGKYDQTTFVGTNTTAIGRIDFFGLTDFKQSEIQLLKNYFYKNHQFKLGLFPSSRNALIDDGFGVVSPESYASTAWMNFYALSDTIVEAKFFDELSKNYYLVAYAGNSGSYTSVWSSINSEQAGIYPIKTVFAFLFGSYLWDWDVERNLLRSVLASRPNALVSCWIGRPFWHLHYFARGEPLAFSFIRTANNQNLYRSTGMFGYRGAHISLLGDPTLRLFYPKPIENLSFSYVQMQNKENIRLNWSLPADTQSLVGFVILKSNSLNTPFAQIAALPANTNEFVDNDVIGKPSFYQVRAVYLITSKFGAFRTTSIGRTIRIE